MTNRHYRYLWLKREREESAPPRDDMSVHYENLATEKFTVGLVFSAGVIIWLIFKEAHQLEIKHPADTWVLGGVVALNFFIGLRWLDSCFLASRDYRRLQSVPMWDFLLFVFLLVFTTGIVPKAALIYTGDMREAAYFTCFVFVGLSVFGALNSYTLGFFRLKNRPLEWIDYPVDRRIQIFNIIIMAVYFVCFTLAGMYLWIYPNNYFPIIVISIIVLVATGLNVEHSRRLTMRPKLLLSNKCDLVDQLMADIKAYLSHCPWIDMRDDSEIKAMLLKNWDQEKLIKLVRVAKDGVPFLATVLFEHFDYIFHYILVGDVDLDKSKKEKIIRVIEKLLRSGCGYGKMGYMNYYFIQNNEDEKVGVIGTKTSRWTPFTLYGLFDHVGVALHVLKEFGFIEFSGIIKRAKETELSHLLRAGANEWVLTHLVIFKPREGYGIATVRLLINAYLREYTDKLEVNSWRVLVRESNIGGIKLFKKAGFKICTSQDLFSKNDPIGETIHYERTIGRPLVMECKRSDCQESI